jgi:hypothetical protein
MQNSNAKPLDPYDLRVNSDNDDNLAMRLKLEERLWCGLLVIDEVSIQGVSSALCNASWTSN